MGTEEKISLKHDIANYDFVLDNSRIAVMPYLKRDEARLLVFNRSGCEIKSKKFGDIIDYFNAGDMLVLNETKVFKARLYGTKAESGARRILDTVRQAADSLLLRRSLLTAFVTPWFDRTGPSHHFHPLRAWPEADASMRPQPRADTSRMHLEWRPLRHRARRMVWSGWVFMPGPQPQ